MERGELEAALAEIGKWAEGEKGANQVPSHALPRLTLWKH